MSTSKTNKDDPKKGLPAPNELAKSKETALPAPPEPPKGGGNIGNGGDENRRPSAKGSPALVGATLALLVMTIIALITFSVVNLMKDSGKETASSASAAQEELNRLRAELAKQAAGSATSSEEGEVTTHPSQSNGLKTFDPTTRLDGRNMPNIPTVTRVQKIAAPAGDIYLLFGEDPILKRERMITNGMSVNALPEPIWEVSRPAGELVVLKRPPPGLNLPPGRYAVAVVAMGGEG